MCTGLEIGLLLGSAALSAGGSMIASNEQQANAERMAAARNRELAATLAKNKALAEQSRAVYQQREDAQQPAEIQARQEQLTEDRSAATTGAVQGDTPESVPLKGSAPDVVKSDVAKKLLDATRSAKESAKQLGTLGGFGDLWFDQGLQNNAAGRDVGMYQNFVEGNMGILPYAQDFAEYQAYRPSSGLGEIMQGAGSVLGSFGGGGTAGSTLGPYASKFKVAMGAPKPGLIF